VPNAGTSGAARHLTGHTAGQLRTAVVGGLCPLCVRPGHLEAVSRALGAVVDGMCPLPYGRASVQSFPLIVHCMDAGPAGYFITFCTYGSRLHGDERGSVDRRNNGWDTETLTPNQMREAFEKSEMDGSGRLLKGPQRVLVADTILEVCQHKSCPLFAVNVRTNHVHVVVNSSGPELTMNAFKAWSTRRLREAGLLESRERLWSRHGSTPYLWFDRDVSSASLYALEGQGEDLGGTRAGSAWDEIQ
jgi:REP element-mobilizing transposase RayT